MKKDYNNFVVILLVVIIVILAVLCVLFATDTISFHSKNHVGESGSNVSDDESQNSNDTTVEKNNISQKVLETIVNDELYIITNRNMGRNTIKTIHDIESYDLETLVINKFNSSSSTLTSISKNEMQDILNETCLSNLSITFDGTYTKGEYTKRNLYYGKIGAYKTVSFKQDNGKYMLSMKFIFVDNGDSGDRGENGYGNMDSLKNSTDPIIQIYDFDTMTQKVLDLQQYLDDNFDSIKDKLATYDFIFEKQNDKIVLTDLSVN